MSDEIKQKQKSLQSVIEALQRKKDEIQTLKDKKKDFDFGEGSTAEESKTIRKKTLIDFILGKVTKKDVDSANEAVFKVEQDGKFQEEMAMAIDDVLKKMEAQIPSLQNAIGVAKTKLWESIYDGIKIEAQKAVRDLPIQALAAGVFCEKQHQWVLFDVFAGGSIHIEAINEAAQKLAKKYEIED